MVTGFWFSGVQKWAENGKNGSDLGWTDQVFLVEKNVFFFAQLIIGSFLGFFFEFRFFGDPVRPQVGPSSSRAPMGCGHPAAFLSQPNFQLLSWTPERGGGWSLGDAVVGGGLGGLGDLKKNG